MRKRITGMMRLLAVLLVFLTAIAMTPFAGGAALASSDSAVVKAAKEAGVDIKDKQQVETFEEALDAEGIDLDSPEVSFEGGSRLKKQMRRRS